jgi:hypothetical protein
LCVLYVFYSITPKCFAIDKIASKDHNILNQIIVGNVFTVDDQINERLEASARIYNHQNCFPNKRPGKIIAIFVIKAKNSTVFGLSQ